MFSACCVILIGLWQRRDLMYFKIPTCGLHLQITQKSKKSLPPFSRKEILSFGSMEKKGPFCFFWTSEFRTVLRKPLGARRPYDVVPRSSWEQVQVRKAHLQWSTQLTTVIPALLVTVQLAPELQPPNPAQLLGDSPRTSSFHKVNFFHERRVCVHAPLCVRKPEVNVGCLPSSLFT